MAKSTVGQTGSPKRIVEAAVAEAIKAIPSVPTKTTPGTTESKTKAYTEARAHERTTKATTEGIRIVEGVKERIVERVIKSAAEEGTAESAEAVRITIEIINCLRLVAVI